MMPLMTFGRAKARFRNALAGGIFLTSSVQRSRSETMPDGTITAEYVSSSRSSMSSKLLSQTNGALYSCPVRSAMGCPRVG